MSTEWYIDYYERQNDKFVKQVRLANIDLPQLRALYGEPADAPMVDAYPIDQRQLSGLEQMTGLNIDIENYDCFIVQLDISS